MQSPPLESSHPTLHLFFVLLLSSCALPTDYSVSHMNSLAGASATKGSLPTAEAIVHNTASTTPSAVEPVVADGHVQLLACLQEALKKNLDVSISKLDVTKAKAKAEGAKAEFDPELMATLLSAPGSVNSDETNAILRKKFVTGTEVRVEGGTVFFDNNDRTGGTTSKGNEYALRIRQPLFRGASIAANRAGMEVARINAKSADASQEAQILEMLRAAESTYWMASYANQLWKFQQASLKRAQKVFEIVNTRKEAGAATRLDVLEAEAAVATARDTEVSARKQYMDTIATLWQIVGREVTEPDARLVFVSLARAQLPTAKPDPEASYKMALARSPTAVLLANEVQARTLLMNKARNDRLPKVDLEFNGGTGNALSFQQSNSTLSNPDNMSWNALLRVSLPWTFRAERAQLEVAKADLERSQVSRTKALRELKLQIFETCREIESGRNQVEATATSAAVNKAKWDEQFRRYEEGITSVRDLLEAEGAYRNAEARELESRLRLIIADVLLARQQGTLAQRNRMIL